MSSASSSYDLALEMSEGGDFELPAKGNYIIEFLGVTDTKDWPKTTQGGQNIFDDDGNQVMETSLTLQFRIDEDDEDYPGVEFRDYFPLRVTAKNKSGWLWAAFWGCDPEELPSPLPRVRDFIGKKASATLMHRNASNGNTYAKIKSAVPLKKKRRQAPVEDDAGEPRF